MNQIDMLYDTLNLLDQSRDQWKQYVLAFPFTRQEMEKVRVLLPDAVHSVTESNARLHCEHHPIQTSCTDQDTLSAAMKFRSELNEDQKLLVLNFANAFNPGGGVRNGAKAQEEDLCRRSSLLLSLESDPAQKFYHHHRMLESNLASDAMILSPNTVIIKDEAGRILLRPVEIAVITCAAPNISLGRYGLDDAQYENLFRSRIRSILNVALAYGYENLVLGAFGCGAFGNDAETAARLFEEELRVIEYRTNADGGHIQKVLFAVLDHSVSRHNYRTFSKYFNHYNQDLSIETPAHKKRRSRVRGSLIGGAAGDALGYAVEFKSEGKIFSKYGPKGIISYELDSRTGKAMISDDTQMTLFTAIGIMDGDTINHVKDRNRPLSRYAASIYQDWLYTQEGFGFKKWTGNHRGYADWLMTVPQLYSQRAPGLTCLNALEKDKPSRKDYIHTPVNDSKGCGGIMRAAPCGLYQPEMVLDEESEKALILDAAQTAAVTHGNSLGYMGAGILADLIARILVCDSHAVLRELACQAVEAAEKVFKEDSRFPKQKKLLEKAMSLSENSKSDLENIRELGEGWVGEETLAIALYCSLRHSDNFSRGIIAAVNHSGDSDSTGSVTGNILGAWIGYDAIEQKWKKDLELKDVILEIADDLSLGYARAMENEEFRSEWTNKYGYKAAKEDSD